MKVTRRQFAKLGLVGTAGLALPLGGCSISTGEGDLTGKLVRSATPLPEPFMVPLPVPPVLSPVSREGGVDIYEIVQQEGQTEIIPGFTTKVWGYNGIFPGPTIDARRDHRIVVRQRNELSVPVSVHLHGGVSPPESDGYPTDLIAPGETKEYSYPLQQRAATLWYHDHRMDFTGPQVYRGLAGIFIVRDNDEDALPLPAGEKEIPLFLADRSFKEDGSFSYPSRDPSLVGEPGVEDQFRDGVLGDVVLVNGAPWPFLEVSATRYRFRILNASNARRYQLELDPPPREGPTLVQIGSDGGLLASPVAHDRLAISPAERFDVVIDFSQYGVGDRVTLANRFGDGSTAQIMEFRIVRSQRDEYTVPDRLAEVERLDAERATETRRFRFHSGEAHGHRGWVIDGEPFSPDTIAARPRLDEVEIWEFRGNAHHPIHVHLVHFQVLSRDGGKPAARDTGWKDTVNLDEGEKVRVIARFTGYRGKYVFHCHNLEHEDMAMMANFEVI
jgi:spore coat protein A, manganese oxidase